MKKNPTQKSFFLILKLYDHAVPRTKEFCFGGITPKPKIGIL
jgi:hypothetical protein